MELPQDTRFVVTGFQAFGDHEYNPSFDAARGAAEALGVDPHLLPVTYTAASQYARAILTAARPLPVFFLHFGLSADRERVGFEARAKNLRDNTPDNLEKTLPIRMPRAPRELVSGDRVERLTLLPLPSLVEAYEELRAGDEDAPAAEISQDCGRYVCNALLYHSLRACEAARAEGHFGQALFVHIPAMSPEAARAVGSLVARSIAP